MTFNHPSDPLDSIHEQFDTGDRPWVRILTRRPAAAKRPDPVKRDWDAPLLDTEREHRVRAEWGLDAEALSQSVPLIHRMFHELLINSRRVQVDLRGRDCPAPLFDLPSITEILTIHQFGFPRSYNLNDGMGTDMAS